MTDEFTLSFWFRIDDNSGTFFQYLVSFGDLSVQNSLQVLLVEDSTPGVQNPPGTLRTALRDTNDPLDELSLDVNINSLIGDGNWHLYTLTTETGVGSKVYVDGVLEASDWRGGDAFNPATNLFFGGRQDLNVDRFLNGSLDGIRIYDQALDASAVSALHNRFDMTGTVHMTVNAHPVLTMAAGGNSYTENDAVGTFVDTSVTVTDSDLRDFDGGVLTTTITGNGTANDRLVDLLPEALRPHEGLVVEAGDEHGRRQRIDGAHIEIERGPAVLALRHQAIEKLDHGGARVGFLAAPLAQFHQRIGL